MAGSIKVLHIGVIAEEHNDVEVIEELASKVVKKSAFSISRFVGHGCGKLRNKCAVWAQNLRERGCDLLVVVHDLDRNELDELSALLRDAVGQSGFQHYLVLIPVEELEAWLLCDAAAIKTVFNMRQVPRVPNRPESINSPKEYLGNLVRKNSRTQYLNTVHNRRIAARMALNSLSKCPSFSTLPKFLLPRFAKAARL